MSVVGSEEEGLQPGKGERHLAEDGGQQPVRGPQVHHASSQHSTRCILDEFIFSKRKFFFSPKVFTVHEGILFTSIKILLFLRTWQSMKEHFRKQIIPRIQTYGLTSKQVARFKDQFGLLPLNK